MEYKFIDMNCNIGRKPLPVNDICYSKDSVKNTLLNLNVKRAYCSHNAAVFGCDFESNKCLKKDISGDDFFRPSYTLIVNNGKENPLDEFEKILSEDNIRVMNMNSAVQGFSVDLFTLSDYFDIMDKKGITLNVSNGNINDKWLSDVLSVYKNMKIIINNIAFSNTLNIRKHLKLFENVYIDTSYTMTEGIESIVNEFGSERIVLSSYAPESSPTGYIGRIILASLKREDKDNIAYKNAERLTGEVL